MIGTAFLGETSVIRAIQKDSVSIVMKKCTIGTPCYRNMLKNKFKRFSQVPIMTKRHTTGTLYSLTIGMDCYFLVIFAAKPPPGASLTVILRESGTAEKLLL